MLNHSLERASRLGRASLDRDVTSTGDAEKDGGTAGGAGGCVHMCVFAESDLDDFIAAHAEAQGEAQGEPERQQSALFHFVGHQALQETWTSNIFPGGRGNSAGGVGESFTTRKVQGHPEAGVQKA